MHCCVTLLSYILLCVWCLWKNKIKGRRNHKHGWRRGEKEKKKEGFGWWRLTSNDKECDRKTVVLTPPRLWAETGTWSLCSPDPSGEKKAETEQYTNRSTGNWQWVLQTIRWLLSERTCGVKRVNCVCHSVSLWESWQSLSRSANMTAYMVRWVRNIRSYGPNQPHGVFMPALALCANRKLIGPPWRKFQVWWIYSTGPTMQKPSQLMEVTVRKYLQWHLDEHKEFLDADPDSLPFELLRDAGPLFVREAPQQLQKDSKEMCKWTLRTSKHITNKEEENTHSVVFKPLESHHYSLSECSSFPAYIKVTELDQSRPCVNVCALESGGMVSSLHSSVCPCMKTQSWASLPLSNQIYWLL